MISAAQIRDFALSLPETDEAPHFQMLSYRVKKKIFVTVNAAEHRATLKFTPEMQDVFTSISQGVVYPVPNKWGKHGWTHIDLQHAAWELCQDALQNAWCSVAPPSLLAKHPELTDET